MSALTRRGVGLLAPALALAAAPASSKPRNLVQPGTVEIAARRGRVVQLRSSGLADLENGVPLTPGSVMRIGSLTKQFTAVAVLKLVHDGRLALNERLAALLPDCPPAWGAIEVRHLLSHTSGITGDMAPIFSSPYEDRTPEGLVSPFRKLTPPASPGARWRYSNVNFWLLGLLIEARSGEPYEAHILRAVLTQAMPRTRYGGHAPIIPGRAHGYEAAKGGGWVNAPYFSQSIGWAAGGFLSTPREMAAWYGALAAGEIIAPDMLRLAGEEVRTTDGKATGYGLGWYVGSRGGERVLHHGGSSPGFVSYVWYDPEQGRFAGVFRNVTDADGEPRDEAGRMFDAMA